MHIAIFFLSLVQPQICEPTLVDNAGDAAGDCTTAGQCTFRAAVAAACNEVVIPLALSPITVSNSAVTINTSLFIHSDTAGARATIAGDSSLTGALITDTGFELLLTDVDHLYQQPGDGKRSSRRWSSRR